jgi:hypothetical protein
VQTRLKLLRSPVGPPTRRSICAASSWTCSPTHRPTPPSPTSSPMPVVSMSSSTTPATWCSAQRKPSRLNSSVSNTTSMSSGRSGSTGQPGRAAAPAPSAQGPHGLGRILVDAWRHANFPSALFRGQGGDGCAGRILLHRACAVGHRDDDHGAGRIYQGHQPFRSPLPAWNPPMRTSRKSHARSSALSIFRLASGRSGFTIAPTRPHKHHRAPSGCRSSCTAAPAQS